MWWWFLIPLGLLIAGIWCQWAAGKLVGDLMKDWKL